MGETVVEHWWNGQWGRMGSRHLYLLRLADGRPGLRVRCRAGEGTFPYDTEAAVRRDIAVLMQHYGPWARVDA